LKERAEVAIIGGGVHGLAIAYNLALRGIEDVVVLERSYIGSGASGRNAGGIRAQYASKENIELAKASLEIAEKISAELGFNIMFRQTGYLYLARSEEQVRYLERAVRLQNSLGVRTRIVHTPEIREIVPLLNTEGVLAGSYNGRDGIARHDAVVWGYARAARRLGVEINQYTEVTGVEARGGEVRAVRTSRGTIITDTVVNAAGAHSREVARWLGVELPIIPAKREILVTESLEPFLDPMVIDLETTAYFNQTDRGEVVAAIHVARDEAATYDTSSTLTFLERISRILVHFFPRLRPVRVLRQWAGTYDVTPDGSPILGPVEEVRGFIQANGFSGAGFKLCHIVGRLLAEYIVTGVLPPLIRPYGLSRFREGRLIRELEAG
jgi:sarcosine oxidase subunit beta